MAKKGDVKAEVAAAPEGATADGDAQCLGAPPFAAGDDKAIEINKDGYGYVFDRFIPSHETRDKVQLAIALYRSALLPWGWRRVFVADAITGQPGTFVQLWRVPVGELSSDKLGEREDSAAHAAFKSGLVRFARAAFDAMPYDAYRGSQPSTVADGPPNVLLLNDVTVKKGALARFAFLKQSFFIDAVGADPFRWRLVGAGALRGHSNRILQMWELPDADTLPYTMRRAGQNLIYRRCLEPCIEAEDQQLYEVVDWT
jgi:hypothetical protein